MSLAGDEEGAVAIIGMAAVFPGAGDLDAYWSNLLNGVDAIGEVPPQRWDPVFYDPADNGPDRFYCKRGGFVDGLVDFDPTAFSMMPATVDGIEPDQLIALATAAAALDDAGGPEVLSASNRAGVVLGRGGYIGAGQARLDQRTRVAEQLVRSLGELVPSLGHADLAAVRDEFQRRIGPQGGEDAIGLVPNLVASRVANRFDLRGPAFTVDAACASSLVAVDHAVQELQAGRCDLMLAGGVHHCHDLTLWSVFTQLGALSRRGEIRPFDRSADGLLIAEGTGMVVLQRLADAERAGHRIYAVIRGVGVASDGRATSLMRPSPEGEAEAIRRGWDAARLDPATMGLIEAHGTATPIGDEAELSALADVFGPQDGTRVPLGSVKSMIGHAMPAAGMAGLIKTALALHHRVVPPTLHCDEPHPGLAATRFRPVTEAEPWAADGGPRRAGVNAFGFGGINAHVVLEEHGVERRAVARARHGQRARTEGSPAAEERVILCAAGDRDELLAQLDAELREVGAAGRLDPAAPLRLAVVDPSPQRIAMARNAVALGEPWRGRLDVWFTPRPLLADGGKLAFLFPGLEADFSPRMDDVAEQLGRPAPQAAEAAGLGGHGVEVTALGRLLEEALGQLGVEPDLVAGHSVGEWAGMLATGMVPPDQVGDYLAALDPANLRVPDVVFAAAGCGAEQLAAIIDGIDGVVVSHDNCPHQSIVCGPEAAVAAVVARCKARRILCEQLPFRSGFHSPMLEPYLDPIREGLERLSLQPARVPLWSATTCRPYPDDPHAVRQLALRHLVEPVRFRELLLALHDAGARAFVQLGVGSIVGFADDTLRGREYVAVAAASPKRDGRAQLRRVAAALWAEGAPVRMDAPLLGGRPDPGPGPGSTGPGRRALDLGTRLVSLEGLTLPAGGRDRRPPEARRVVEVVSVERMPWLADHSLFRQRQGWPFLADRHPVVPLTTMIRWMAEAAGAAAPGWEVVGLERVRANRWLAAAPPSEVTITATPDGPDRVKVVIEGYAQATVVLGDRMPPAPPPSLDPTADEELSLISAARLYADRWMFHGPSFQSVHEVTAISPSGLRGSLQALPAPGSLLDGAGQLVGYWVMARLATDRVVLPTGVDRIELFGPEPAPGSVVDCAVAITSVDDSSVRADVELVSSGRVWARLSGWTERRFETDGSTWAVHRFPEFNLLSEPRRGGWVLTRERWRRTASRDVIARHYLAGPERAEYERLNPLAQRQWLLGRVAVKDAVRDWLWGHGAGPVFPAEVLTGHDEHGAPTVRGAFGTDLHVSVAHRGSLAVAIAREGGPVGIDVELVAERPERFAQIAATPAERALAGLEGEPDMTRLWVAKEAAAKRTGAGLQHNPKRFEVTGVDLPTLAVGDVQVETEAVIEGGETYVVGWTTH